MNFSKKNYENQLTIETMMSKTKFTFLALLISGILLGQNGINYKALIKDDLGNVVVNGNVFLSFTILKGAAQEIVYSETHSTSTNEKGMLILNIGEGTPFTGNFSDIEWEKDDHFLMVIINNINLGITQFKTVPYALNAANVNGLEAIDEGNGIGWRLVDRNAAYYGNIGENAVDLSFANSGLILPGALGLNSFATGYFNTALGDYSTTLGYLNEATGEFSTAMGRNTTASGESSTTTGRNTAASGDNSTAMGYGTQASGLSSFASGFNSIASNTYATAIGANAEAAGSSSVAIGTNASTRNFSSNSIAIGYNTYASGNYAMAMGYESTASGERSTTLGQNATAAGDASLAFGENSFASTNNTIAFGLNSTATGNGATALGTNAHAVGQNSLALGYGTIAQGYRQVVVGAYNVPTGDPSINYASNPIFIVGSGASNTIRYNALTVLANRKVGIRTSQPTVPLQIASSGYEASLNDESGIMVLGNEDSTNLVLDNNEILARNNGATSNLLLQQDGGRVGIGVSSPAEALHIEGRLRIGTETVEDSGSNELSFNAALLPDADGAFTLGNSQFKWRSIWAIFGNVQTSDRRSKTNIANLNYGLKEVMQLNPVSFKWKNFPDEDTKLGLIAQDLLKVIPEVVKTHEWQTTSDDEDAPLVKVKLDRLGVYYSDLIPVLINAIKEQNKIIESQKGDISELKSEVSTIKNTMEILLTELKIKSK